MAKRCAGGVRLRRGVRKMGDVVGLDMGEEVSVMTHG